MAARRGVLLEASVIAVVDAAAVAHHEVVIEDEHLRRGGRLEGIDGGKRRVAQDGEGEGELLDLLRQGGPVLGHGDAKEGYPPGSVAALQLGERLGIAVGHGAVEGQENNNDRFRGLDVVQGDGFAAEILEGEIGDAGIDFVVDRLVLGSGGGGEDGEGEQGQRQGAASHKPLVVGIIGRHGHTRFYAPRQYSARREGVSAFVGRVHAPVDSRTHSSIMELWTQAPLPSKKGSTPSAHGCKALGLSLTPQRLAVYQILAGTGEHPGAEDIYQRLKPSIPSLSRGTVYRTLTLFESHGLVSRVPVSDDQARFDANLDNHHHLVCVRCQCVTDVQDSRWTNCLSSTLPRTASASISIASTSSVCAASARASQSRTPPPNPLREAPSSMDGGSRGRTPPPNPLPEAERGSRKRGSRLSYSPSPLRGGGRGVGFCV